MNSHVSALTCGVKDRVSATHGQLPACNSFPGEASLPLTVLTGRAVLAESSHCYCCPLAGESTRHGDEGRCWHLLERGEVDHADHVGDEPRHAERTLGRHHG